MGAAHTRGQSRLHLCSLSSFGICKVIALPPARLCTELHCTSDCLHSNCRGGCPTAWCSQSHHPEISVSVTQGCEKPALLARAETALPMEVSKSKLLRSLRVSICQEPGWRPGTRSIWLELAHITAEAQDAPRRLSIFPPRCRGRKSLSGTRALSWHPWGHTGLLPLQQHLVGGQHWVVLILGEEGRKWPREQKYSTKTREIPHVLCCTWKDAARAGWCQHSTARGGISTQKCPCQPHGDTVHSNPQHTLQPSPSQHNMDGHPYGWMDKQTHEWSCVWMDGQMMELHAHVRGPRLQLSMQTFFCLLGQLNPSRHTHCALLLLSSCCPELCYSSCRGARGDGTNKGCPCLLLSADKVQHGKAPQWGENKCLLGATHDSPFPSQAALRTR